MKILLITLEYPPQKGGVASYYAGLVEELKRQGHEVEVIADSPTPPHPPSGRGGNHRLLSRWIWPRWLRGYFTVRAAINAQNPDVLFVGHLLPLGTIAYLLRRRVPYVVFTHGMDVLIAQKSWRKRWLARKILSYSKLVIANSEFTKNTIWSICDDRHELTMKVLVVHPCPTISTTVNPEDIDVLRRKLGLTGKKVLLTLGRVVERKGHDLVIKALPEILDHVPSVVYVVAGDGPDLGRLPKMVARSPSPQSSPIKGEEVKQSPSPHVGEGRGEGLQAHVRFVGAVSDEERALYYALCDLFVMPSRQIGPDVEGFGLSFLEAALFGKPSIGGQSGGVPEAILDGQTGTLVDPINAGALARAVVQLLRDDRLREELGHVARSRVLEEFTWVKQVKNLAFML